jgi:hypothetical protein
VNLNPSWAQSSYKPNGDYADTSAREQNIVETDEKPGTELSATGPQLGTADDNLCNIAGEKVLATEDQLTSSANTPTTNPEIGSQSQLGSQIRREVSF